MSRKGWMYWARPLFALAGMIAALAMFYGVSPNRMGVGDPMLWMLSAVTMGLALFCGCVLTADCISSEKREDTLGLLFLTNLKGYDVVAGKIAIHGITTLCGLLAVFPVFFLPILAGGVTWGETLRVLLAIMVSFVFALTLGVWISTRSRDARNATMVTVVVVCLVVALPLLWIAVVDLFTGRAPGTGVPQLSPGMLLLYARDIWYSGPEGRSAYWVSMAIFTTASAVFTTLASRYLVRAWRQEEAQRADAAVPVRRLFRFFRRGAKFRRRLRFESINPFEDLFLSRFKDFRWARRLRQLMTLSFVVLVLFAFTDDEPFVLAMMLLYATHLGAKFVFAFDATRPLSDEKRSSALELLLITPPGERAIAQGFAAAFERRFKFQGHRLLVFTIALQAAAIFCGEFRRGDDLLLISSFLWGPLFWTWSDQRTIAWVGMDHALRQSTHLKAMLRTIASMLLPWAPFFVVLFMMATSGVDEAAAGVITFAWAIGATMVQSSRARRRRFWVLREFRKLASGSSQQVEKTPEREEMTETVFPPGSGARWLADWIASSSRAF